MDTKDYAKQFQDLVFKETSKMLEDETIESSHQMMDTMIASLEAAVAAGVDLPPAVLEQIDLLKTMQRDAQDIAKLMESGNHEDALAMSKQFAIDAGAPGANDEPYPEIFDAIEEGDLASVKGCLDLWDVNETHGQYQSTALYHAVSTCGFTASFPIMHALLDAGADPRLGLGEGYNVLQGLGFGHYIEEMVDDLVTFIMRCVSLGADIEQRSDNLDWTPLHTGLMEWNVPVCGALLKAGADPNATTSKDAKTWKVSQTGLGMVISRPTLFALLLDHGANPDAPDAFGDTVRQMLGRELEQATDKNFAASLAQTQALLKERAALQ